MTSQIPDIRIRGAYFAAQKRNDSSAERVIIDALLQFMTLEQRTNACAHLHELFTAHRASTPHMQKTNELIAGALKEPEARS